MKAIPIFPKKEIHFKSRNCIKTYYFIGSKVGEKVIKPEEQRGKTSTLLVYGLHLAFVRYPSWVVSEVYHLKELGLIYFTLNFSSKFSHLTVDTILITKVGKKNKKLEAEILVPHCSYNFMKKLNNFPFFSKFIKGKVI